MSSQIGTAWADVAAMTREHGLQAVMERYGLTNVDLAFLLVWGKEDVQRASDLAHAFLLGLALADLRERGVLV